MKNKIILQEIANSISRWLMGDGPEADIVLSCRVRLARNLKDFVFPPYAQPFGLKQSAENILNSIRKSNYFKDARIINISELSPVERRFFLERHLISLEFTKNENYRFLVVGKGEMISIMINEEDHLRLQSIFSGLQLGEAWQLSDIVDDELEKSLDYAFSSKWGYLTACPTNTGTGMRASCMLHLPGLVATQRINEALKGISQLGLVARGLYGEGTKSQGNFFQISNQVTLGVSEEEIVNNVGKISREVVKEERKGREILFKRDGAKLKDSVGRAYGLLVNAYLISLEEAMDLLSKVRLGFSLNLLPEVRNIRVLNELLFLIAPVQIQIKEERGRSSFSRDELRAKIIRKKLRE
ncbi:MAG: protein arginine kinase [Candidatus Aerophobetes bacterium]|nr:protein arginine kinase [Candidatus Aerophobetes bacterium]